jgi:DHA1 family bicyclomycin/chloramphenicol resistance-like MFS transporter
MLFWRFIQGLGASAAFVVPETIIHDTYNREKAAKILGIYGSIITFVMSFAPIIGNYLYITYSWRANFVLVALLSTIALISAIIFVRESLHHEKRIIMHPPSIMKSYIKLLKSPLILANLYLCCAVSSAYFAYVANLSLIFVDHMGVSKTQYGYYQSIILLVFALTSFSSGKMIHLLGMHRTRVLGTTITSIGALLFLLFAIFAGNNPVLITIAMTIFTAGFALNVGIFSSDYINVYPDIKGIAAALGGSIGLIAMLVTIGLTGYFFNGTMMPVAIVIAFSGVTSLGVLYWLHRQK